MRAQSVTAIVFSCIGVLTASAAAKFSGSWASSHGSVCAFSLELTQHGQSIAGYHSAVAHGGNKLDATLAPDDSPSIRGRASGDVAHVHFTSSFGGEGEATMILRGNRLEWHIDSSHGTHYFPASEILHRVNSSHAESPNQAMEPTTGRRTTKFPMTSTSHPAATCALASGGSSCSR